ncbi:hypothetical protein SCFA_600005 [anaerobic digester metagenome]|uniref:Uncharacterized protein n=1 Tax=anaerobic digester metagenome TaxID=1263854 RepID=A0A485M7J0_9ZZZZ
MIYYMQIMEQGVIFVTLKCIIQCKFWTGKLPACYFCKLRK